MKLHYYACLTDSSKSPGFALLADISSARLSTHSDLCRFSFSQLEIKGSHRVSVVLLPNLILWFNVHSLNTLFYYNSNITIKLHVWFSVTHKKAGYFFSTENSFYFHFHFREMEIGWVERKWKWFTVTLFWISQLHFHMIFVLVMLSSYIFKTTFSKQEHGLDIFLSWRWELPRIFHSVIVGRDGCQFRHNG